MNNVKNQPASMIVGMISPNTYLDELQVAIRRCRLLHGVQAIDIASGQFWTVGQMKNTTENEQLILGG